MGRRMLKLSPLLLVNPVKFKSVVYGSALTYRASNFIFINMGCLNCPITTSTVTPDSHSMRVEAFLLPNPIEHSSKQSLCIL